LFLENILDNSGNLIAKIYLLLQKPHKVKNGSYIEEFNYRIHN